MSMSEEEEERGIEDKNLTTLVKILVQVVT